MPAKRVTMQDIADACGLSRNTVSKVFNGRGAVPQDTQALVLKKAEELGYGSSVITPLTRSDVQSKNIALLTCSMPRGSHLGTSLLTSFTNQISRSGYSLKIFEISQEELKRNILLTYFSPEQITGIICIELFNADYLNMICDLGIPTICFDGPVGTGSTLMNCNYITMESIASILSIMKKLISLGAHKIGFVGDKLHCESFYERWYGYCSALKDSGLPQDDRICILASDDSPYNNPDWLISQLEQMPVLPDAFICANDYLAIHLISALKKKGLKIPDQVMVTGFDGTPQSALVDPPLTTVDTPGKVIGHLAADILMNRIANPDFPFFTTRVRTMPVWRGSIRGI